MKIFSTRLDHLFFGFPTLKCDGVQIRIKKQTNLEVAKCSSYKFHQKTAISFQVITDMNDVVVYVSPWFGGASANISQFRLIMSEINVHFVTESDAFLLDGGYQGLNLLKGTALTPWKQPNRHSGQTLSEEQINFNNIQRRYRSGIERTFGEIKNTFLIFYKVFNGTPNRLAELWKFACAIYNCKKRHRMNVTPCVL